MSHAERCPVCAGAGTITPKDGYKITGIIQTICYGCNGRGWVEVSD